MATLTDAFLADLNELSDGDEEEAEVQEDELKMEKDDLAAELAAADDIAAVAKLSASPKYRETLERVKAEVAEHGDAMPASWAGPSEADPTYRLIVACNELAMAVDDEIARVHVYVQEKYRKRFPELEGLVLEPLAYARVVARIGNEESVIDVDLDGVVPRHVQMTVSVSASTTDGEPLAAGELARVLDACAMMEALHTDRDTLTGFVGSRMALVAPNLSAVCGANVAAKLVGAAGGLTRLSEIPACNIQVLGQKRRINAGLSTRNAGLHRGHVFECPLVLGVPPDHRQKAGKLIANKVALLARYDAFGGSGTRDGAQGAAMRADIERTLEKRMEPPPAAIAKPLPAPDGVTKKRRGGRRWRKQKERAAATEMMKQANRMQFGTAEEEYLDGDETYGLGMLGKEGHGKLKLMQTASSLGKRERVLQKSVAAAAAGRGGSGSASSLLSGTQSSLAFSAVQGIELENPDREHAAQADVGGARTSGTESYFSELSGFRKIT